VNNGILAPQPFSAAVDLMGMAIEPLLGNAQPTPVPYHYPQSYDFRIGNSDGTSSEDYVLVIDTSKGTSTTIFLTINGFNGGYMTIDWGDGTNGCLTPLTGVTRRPGSYETRLEFVTVGASFAVPHVYSKHGIYRIIVKGIFLISGTFLVPAPQPSPASVLISVESFGKETNRISSINYNGATNLTYVPPYLPRTVTSLFSAFANCSNLNQKEIATWDVSRVTSFQTTFQNVTKFPIEGDWNWNTSSGSMFQTFSAARINRINFNRWTFSNLLQSFIGAIINDCSFTSWSGADASFAFNNATLNNCTLSGWRITSAANNMFAANLIVSNIHVPSWDLRGTTNCSSMFAGFNGSKSGLNDWNVSGVTNMSNMFSAGSDFMTADLSNWDISKVTNFQFFMLRGVAFSPVPDARITINNWGIPSGAILTGMFGDPAGNKFASLSGWSFGGNSAASMFAGFNYTSSLNRLRIDLSSWDTSGINNMSRMFYGIGSELSLGDLSQWNTSNVTDMSGMFQFSRNFNSSVSGWDTSKVTNMSSLFYDASSFLGSGLENWNTSNVTNMNSMFYMDSNRGPNANLSGWNTSKVTNMANMFVANNNFIHRFAGSGIDNWNVTGVTTINGMFNSNNAINTTLRCNLSGWNLCNCTDMTNFMRNCNIGSGNYDILLNSWEASSTGNPIKPWATGINVNFGFAKYTAASSGARQRLINYGWTITDGGFQA